MTTPRCVMLIAGGPGVFQCPDCGVIGGVDTFGADRQAIPRCPGCRVLVVFPAAGPGPAPASVTLFEGGVAVKEAEVEVTLSGPLIVKALGEAERTRASVGEVIGKAIALYLLAADSHRGGKAVGVAASPDSLETEFIGF